MDTMSKPNVIEVDSVSKIFTVRKDKFIKERIVNIGRSLKHAERFTALNDVSFEVKAGESIGLIGANGSGKSTLLKMVGGILTPDKGEVRVRGRIAALLELGAGFHPDLTGRENVFLNASMMGLSDEEISAQLDSIIQFSGIGDFIDTQVKFYSSGMYVRLAFAVAVHSDPDILLVDEVLAVGDEPFQQKCMNKIRQFQEEGRSIILVSHSASHITEICNRAVILDHGNVVGIEEPDVAVEILRRMYDEQAARDMQTLSQVRLFDPGENPECEIDAVRIVEGLSSDGKSAEQYFTSGDTISFAFDLSTPRPLKDYRFMFELRDAREQFVFGTASWNIDAQLEEIDGKGTVVLTLPNFNIGAGIYSANLVIRNSEDRGLARSDNAVAFVVRSDEASNGFVYARPRATMG